MIDSFNFEQGFFDSESLFPPYCHTKIWADGKLVYDSEKKYQPKKSNNNVPKNIKGDYDLSIHGNKIVLVDNKDGTTVEAKCHPDDNFDIGTGMEEAFKKLNEKRKADEEARKAIKVGDMVEVVSGWQSFLTHAEWCYKNLPFDLVKQYTYNAIPNTGSIGKVVCIAPLSSNNNIEVVAIQDNEDHVYLMGEHALKKVVR